MPKKAIIIITLVDESREKRDEELEREIFDEFDLKGESAICFCLVVWASFILFWRVAEFLEFSAPRNPFASPFATLFDHFAFSIIASYVYKKGCCMPFKGNFVSFISS